MDYQEIIRYLQVVRKWWWLIAILAVTTVGTLLAIAFLTETVYEATATLQVSAPPPQEVPLYSEFGRQALRAEIEQTQNSLSEFLRAGDVAGSVIRSLSDVPMRTRELRDNIFIEIPKDSELMFVSVHAPEPELAAVLANAVVEHGLDGYGRLRAQPTINTRSFIESELDSAGQELSTAENDLVQFQIMNKLGDLKKMMSDQQDLIKALRLQSDLERSRGDIGKVQAIDAVIQMREVELQNLVGLSAEYSQLNDRVGRARDTYTFLLDKKVEAQVKENQILALSSIQVITPARPPGSPVSAVQAEIVALGGIASVMTGILLAFLMEYLESLGVFRRTRRQHRPAKTDVVVASK
jgi:uncharacterized protein involved in exopolysaccharide biosynthesis